MIDITKKYKSRAGQSVRLLCIDAGGVYPVVALIGSSGGVVCFQDDGMRYKHSESPFDLIEEKECIDIVQWFNIYKDDGDSSKYELGDGHDDKAAADAIAHADRVACVQLTIHVEKGHGL